MKVSILYSESYAPAPGGLERFCIPEPARISFGKHPSSSDAWCFLTETNVNGSWQASCYLSLYRQCPTRDQYLDWITENVKAIYVDSEIWWKAPSTGEIEEGYAICSIEAEERPRSRSSVEYGYQAMTEGR